MSLGSRARALLAAVIVPSLLAGIPASSTAASTAAATRTAEATTTPAAAGSSVTVLAPVRLPGNSLSAVVAVQPRPAQALARTAAAVTVDGEPAPAALAPLLTRETALTLMIDSSAAGPLAQLGDGRSGVAALLDQLPAEGTYSLVTDREQPKVAAAPATGVAQVRRAIREVRTGGGRATSTALTLALGQLPPWPLAQPVIVLVTSATDAGGESASALGARLRAAHVVLAVVHTRSDPAYWVAASTASGGFTVSVGPPGAISAFAIAADALRSRYVMTAGGVRADARRADVSLDLGGQRAGGQVALSSSGASPATAPGWSAQARDRWPWLIPAVAGSAVLVCLILAAAARRRRRSPPLPAPLATPVPRRGPGSMDAAQPAEIVPTLLPRHHQDP